ncbi:hypothetical protein G4B88_026870 [Cannabis sativa]|uniref:Uncharacterized protein n=1 Tax=Cannabis sativa TaxID=3483 RepID=A0A7J6EBA2_CANSA|nr:hypothetical protein G4B88_026870 [Cannabis sativa]
MTPLENYTFRKRKNGMLKKSPNDGEPSPKVFSSMEEAHRVLTRFQSITKIEQTKKMSNQEEYLMNKIDKEERFGKEGSELRRLCAIGVFTIIFGSYKAQPEVFPLTVG